ncbi:UNVERIFIED_CONTAM: hypothetical protein PYX00_002656 [Menopon gallinae]|uniref:Phosphatidic acid phosphatase type 2/haloperoxidase domain-containing protein n=1 Tax=Menopon gallinae TaxID=328185 RepID=A0AAW2HY97_9NEOP
MSPANRFLPVDSREFVFLLNPIVPFPNSASVGWNRRATAPVSDEERKERTRFQYVRIFTFSRFSRFIAEPRRTPVRERILLRRRFHSLPVSRIDDTYSAARRHRSSSSGGTRKLDGPIQIALAEWATAKYHRRGRGSDVWFREWYHHSVAFFFGAGCTQLLTDAAKHTIGRLRPHFFAVCSPNVDCDDPRMRHAYVEDFECRGENVRLIEDARLSFPSGHSSLAAYSMVFLAMYCGARLIRDDFRLVKHVLQFCAIVAAVYTGLTRISDYKHHWSDVLAGLVLGTVTAILTVIRRFSTFSHVTFRSALIEYSFPKVVFVSEPVSRRMCKASPTEACPDDDEGDGGYDAI